MTSSGALALLIARAFVLFGMAVAIGLAPQFWVAIFLFCISVIILLQRIRRVPLAPGHRHIYFAVSAVCFSLFCLLCLVALARRGSTWWILAGLIVFCAGMVFSMARSIYGPDTKV
jgi:lysylphosphatidylglycerol synthetase-like protein (DUF2156 family)